MSIILSAYFSPDDDDQILVENLWYVVTLQKNLVFWLHLFSF